MKIAIFYGETEKKISDMLAACIRSYDSDVVCYPFDSIHDAVADAAALLQGITHMIFVMPKDTVGFDASLSFFFGIGVGKNLSLIIIQQGNLPDALTGYRCFSTTLSLETFEDYFLKEQQAFSAAEKKQHAYKELLDRISSPCFIFNFAKAVQEGSAELVKLFLDAGFNASQCDAEGTPLLSLAVRSTQCEMASLLLEHGADINLCSQDRSYSALMEAALLGELKIAQLLLARHAEVNIQSKDRQTALILAVARQDIPMVKLLLEHHADKNSTDKLGMSALSYAKLFRNKDIIEMMEKF